MTRLVVAGSTLALIAAQGSLGKSAFTVGMRLGLSAISIALAVLLLGTTPAPKATWAPAARSAFSCGWADENHPDIAANDATPDTAGVSLSQDTVRRDFTEYRTHVQRYFTEALAGCKDPKRRNRTLAIQNGDIALIAHALRPDSDEWRTAMNLANQQLTRCVTDYFGTTMGAECQTQLDKNIRLKARWETPTPSP